MTDGGRSSTRPALFLAGRIVMTVWWATAVILPMLLGIPLLLVFGLTRMVMSLRGRRLPMPRWLQDVIVQWLGWLRSGAQHERTRLSEYRHAPLRAAYRPVDERSTASRLHSMRFDSATWRDLGYAVTASAVTIVAVGVLALLWLAPIGVVVLAGLELVVEMVGVPAPPGPAAAAMGLLADTRLAVIGASLLVLLVALYVTPKAVRAVSELICALGFRILGPPPSTRLELELSEQRVRRRLAVDAAETERRRIERDLHDGAQQRLVTLALHLGMAKQRLPHDPEGAHTLVAEAHTEAKQALVELRDLARGIHPAILADRGLDAALSAVARGVPIPVSVQVDVPGELPAPVESAAYFVVTEALTNVSRHAAATRADVRVTTEGSTLRVEVRDDGVGGADPSRGTGLAGLAERVGSVEGALHVTSPHGGPTTISAELPCAS